MSYPRIDWRHVFANLSMPSHGIKSAEGKE